jgi:DNA-binding SARP family transcriptional activator
MSNRVAADRAALAEVQVPSLSVARATGVAEGAWAPEILLIAQPITDSERGRLTHLIHTNPRAAIGVVTTAGPPLTEWAIHLHPEAAGHAVLDPVGLAVTPQSVGPRDHAKMVDLFAATRAEATTAPPPWRVRSPAEPTPVDITNEPPSLPRDDPLRSSSGGANATSWTPVADPTVATRQKASAPLVAVLGPVEVKYTPELPEPTKRAQLTALAAFLAMHPGSSREAVDEAMWPGRRVSTATRNTAMAKLRDWLGTDPDGNDYLPRATTDGYRLHPGIKTDWHMFRELLPSGPATAPSADLVAALDLVRDQPFKGVNPRRYIWAERIQQEMIAAIGDVADELARRALSGGDHRLALKAVMTGLAAEPGSEQLWRHRLRAHHAAGDRIALERAADQLTALADELGGELEDETLELLRQLLRHTSSGHPSSRGEPR